jgi:hypothetical protein
MKFDYKQYEVQSFPGQSNPGIVFRPVLTLRIIGTKSQVSSRSLVDTGADMTVLPKKIASFVGITILSTNPSTALGAGGEIEIAYGNVVLELSSGKKSYRWCATVGISSEPWEEAVLGHVGFLQYFDATFLGEKRAVRLKRNKLLFEAIQLPRH